MRLHLATLVAVLCAPVLLTGQGSLGTYEDRIAVEDVMARYVWSVDSLDADGYVAVFTEEAVIDSNGSISKGHADSGLGTRLVPPKPWRRRKPLIFVARAATFSGLESAVATKSVRLPVVSRLPRCVACTKPRCHWPTVNRP